MAEALRDAYADVFTINEQAQELARPDLIGLFKRASGKGDAVAAKMADTFRTLAGQADFGSISAASTEPDETSTEVASPQTSEVQEHQTLKTLSLRHEVHVHLPSTTDVAVYNAMFRNLRDHLLQ
jgi:hypothetical protein